MGFVAGDIVPGPRVNRDIVPALLAPGEGVINNAAMRRNNGRSLVPFLNHGGTLASGGGGVSVTINQSFTIGRDMSRESSTRIAGAARRGVAEALLDTIGRDPRYRQELRRVLA